MVKNSLWIYWWLVLATYLRTSDECGLQDILVRTVLHTLYGSDCLHVKVLGPPPILTHFHRKAHCTLHTTHTHEWCAWEVIPITLQCFKLHCCCKRCNPLREESNAGLACGSRFRGCRGWSGSWPSGPEAPPFRVSLAVSLGGLGKRASARPRGGVRRHG